jgi:hypothetical protein
MKLLLVVLLITRALLCQASSIAPALTAVYENRRQLVKLKWHHNDKRIISYFLQSSSNNNTWANLQLVKIGNPGQYRFISYTDNNVLAGKNYYRLKAILADGSIEYSSPLMVIIGQPGNSWLIYPVPVRDVLNLQYNGNELIQGVIRVIIQHINGKIFHRLRYASSTRQVQIPVNNLGSGTYDIRIVINNEVVWNQRFVK